MYPLFGRVRCQFQSEIYARKGLKDNTAFYQMIGLFDPRLRSIKLCEQLQFEYHHKKEVVFKTYKVCLVYINFCRAITHHQSIKSVSECYYMVLSKFQIISSLTLQRVEKQFTRHANLDLRKLLVGDNRLLSSIISRVEETFGVFLNAISCTPLPENSRAAISQIICQNAKLHVSQLC